MQGCLEGGGENRQQLHNDRRLQLGLLFVSYLNRCGHGTTALWVSRIVPKRANLIPLQFGVFKGGGEADRTSMVIDLLCDLKTVFFRYGKQMFQHVDDVGVSVLLVVPKDHMIAGLSSSFRFRCARFGLDDRRIQNCSMRLAFHLEHSWRIRKSAGRLIVRPPNRSQKQESVPEWEMS